jgi:hypothetical protein
MFVDKPLHNWASNCADAWRMAGLDLQLPENKFNINNVSVVHISDYDELEV